MTILVLGARWWLVGDYGNRPRSVLNPFPVLPRAGNLVWHPERIDIGVAAFEGDPRHAATLLERKLRAQGEISVDVKIQILQSQRTGRGYQVLYVTVALDEWQQMLSWAAAQRHICGLSLAVVLAFARVQAGCAVVLQAHGHFHFLARHDGQLVHLQAVSVDDMQASLEAVATMLGIQAREEMSSRGCGQFKVLWLPVAFEGKRGDLSALAAAFSQASQGVVVELDSASLGSRDAAGVQLHSGFMKMVRQVRPRALLNEGWDRLHVLARAYLPYGAAAAVVAALGFAWVGYSWTSEASVLRLQTRHLQSEAEKVRQSIALIERDTAMDTPALSRQAEFLAMLRKVQGDHDPWRLLDALRQGAQGGIRILSVGTARGSAGESPSAIVVDGTLPEEAINSDRDTRSLSTLVKTLAEQGYRAEPIDIRSAATEQGASARLFSYRLTWIGPSGQGGS